MTRKRKPPTRAEIKALRARYGLSQPELAELIHVPLRTLQNYEQGQGKLHPGLMELAEIKARDMIHEYADCPRGTGCAICSGKTG